MPLGELITGMRQALRQRGQLGARLGQRHAVADEDHRPLGREQPVDGARDVLGRRPRCAAR